MGDWDWTSDDTIICKECGYSVKAGWGQCTFECPRCKGKRDFVDNLIKENESLKKKNESLKKKIKELEEIIHPSFLGKDI